jgi:hypothetical protein
MKDSLLVFWLPYRFLVNKITIREPMTIFVLSSSRERGDLPVRRCSATVFLRPLYYFFYITRTLSFISWRIDPLLGSVRNTDAANSTGAVFSLFPCTDRCYAKRAQLARARWRHTTVGSDHVTFVFCDMCPYCVYISKLEECSSKLEDYRRVQEVGLWRLKVWFEVFICTVVQWYLECDGYSYCVKIRS